MILIAGPCVIESFSSLKEILERILYILSKRKNIEFFFKSSVQKDNRTKTENYRDIGSFFKGIEYLKDLSEMYNVRTCTDFHSVEQIEKYSEYVDVVQIPAMLGRQVSLLEAAAQSEKIIHLKKPQFMAPKDIKIPWDILRNAGAKRIIVTDRGTSFGYNDLIFDPRNIPIMKMHADEVLVDITHMNKEHSPWYWRSLKLPEILAKSALAAGADGIFAEVHTCPDKAQCDSKTMLNIEEFEELSSYF